MTSAGKREDPADHLLDEELVRAVRGLRGSRPSAVQARYQSAGQRDHSRTLRTAGIGVAAAVVLVGVASYSALAGVGPLQGLGGVHGSRPGTWRGPSSVPPAASPEGTGLTGESEPAAPSGASSTQSATRTQDHPSTPTPAAAPSTRGGAAPAASATPSQRPSPTASPSSSPSPTLQPNYGRPAPSPGSLYRDKPRG